MNRYLFIAILIVAVAAAMLGSGGTHPVRAFVPGEFVPDVRLDTTQVVDLR